jgi:S1-C subfamily serine protease
MGKILKWVLSSTLLLVAIGLCVHRFAEVEWNRVDYKSLLKPITYNASQIDSSIDAQVVLTGQAKVRRNVRNAAVEVVTGMGRGSGTLFEIDGHYLVFTAAHVVNGSPVVSVLGRNGEMVFGTPVLTANEVDMAVILIPQMNSRTPMKYNPAKKQDIDKYVGEEVTYTGFPSHHDLLTIDGVIASEEDGNLVMHSYAWPGASGSGVFDFRGRFVGVVKAVDVGVWSYQVPPQLVEDMVWIAPSWGITKKEIKDQLGRRGTK